MNETTKFSDKMFRTAQTIIRAFFRYRQQFEKEHGSCRDLITVKDDEASIFVMASFKERELMIEYIDKRQKEIFKGG